MFRKKEYQICLPNNWDKLPSKLFWKLTKAHLQRPQLSHHAFQALILKELMQLPFWLYIRLPKDKIADQLLPAAQWAMEYDITQRPQETIIIGKNRWRLPANDASDMTLQQYFHLENFFALLFSKNRDEDAALFLAAFLRLETRRSQRAYHRTGMLPVLSAPELQRSKQLVMHASPEQIFFCVQYYISIRLQLKDRYPNLHSGDTSDNSQKIDWDSIPPRIAEAGVFGSLPQVLATPVSSYLAWANSRAEEQNPNKPNPLQDIIRENHKKLLN